MVSKEFKYIAGVEYSPDKRYSKKVIDLINQKISVSSSGAFSISFLDIFEGYKVTHVKTDEEYKNWSSKPWVYWQNQLHFALWCASTGSGVSMKHVKQGGLMGSMYRFHIYFQTRRILKEISAALPQDNDWEPLNNLYDHRAYERICNEFRIPVDSDFRQKLDDNDGLGRIYQWLKGSWRHTNPWIGDYYAFDWGKEYSSGLYTLTGETTNEVIKIDFFAQGKESENAWTTLIQDTSEGFTRAGVIRLNESIRAYSWSILNAQVNTATGILGTGTAFDAQKQFVTNVEICIAGSDDLPSEIEKYQDTLQYAKSKVDFVFGIGLYMTPSNLEMQIGIREGYNNKIIIATDDKELGVNPDTNSVNLKKEVPSLEGTPTPKSIPESKEEKPKLPEQKLMDIKDAQDHEDTKTALIVGFVAVGILGVIFYRYIF